MSKGKGCLFANRCRGSGCWRGNVYRTADTGQRCNWGRAPLLLSALTFPGSEESLASIYWCVNNGKFWKIPRTTWVLTPGLQLQWRALNGSTSSTVYPQTRLEFCILWLSLSVSDIQETTFLVLQTSSLCYVYPGGTHTRFEHSIGTCVLAEQFIGQLKTRQPELDITPLDILCVEVSM